jgi:hypothetical protein
MKTCKVRHRGLYLQYDDALLTGRLKDLSEPAPLSGVQSGLIIKQAQMMDLLCLCKYKRIGILVSLHKH